ncbi:VOC family protein [Myceligenerans crystallogenes]|uniref:VOC family protein n=1 Tax=Myceligenerans crystallogenes TaxID=316335 RepID=A0ABP4ZQL5_9MICO
MLKFTDFIIDCPDPMALAAFYSGVTGQPLGARSTGDWAYLTFGDIDLAFYRVEHYRPPTWPGDEHPKQYHLDFEVDEFAPEQQRVTALGAELQREFIGPEGYGWQIYKDPVGHPFCLCRNKGYDWAGRG